MIRALLDRLPKQDACKFVGEQVTRGLYLEGHTDELNLSLLGSYLPDDLRRTALAAVYQGLRWPADEPERHAWFLPRFAPLRDDEVAKAFDAAQASSWSDARLIVADVLAPYLPDRLLHEALTRVMAFPLEEECFTALAELGQYQPPATRDQTCKRGLAVAASITHESSKAHAVAALAPIVVCPEHADTAFEILWSVDPYWGWGVRAMEAMAAVLPAARLREVPNRFLRALHPDPVRDMPKILKRLSDEGDTISINSFTTRPEGHWPYSPEDISGLAPILSPSQARRAWYTPEPGDGNFGAREAEALAMLAGYLPEHERAAAVDEVLAVYTPQLDRNERHARVLGQLARVASTERLTQALHEYLARKPPLTDTVLEELAPGLPEALIEEAFQYALSDDVDLCRAVVKLAPRLSGPLLTQAISHVSNSVFLQGKAAALTALARRLPPEDDQDRETVLSMALEVAVSEPLHSKLGGVMADLIPQLPERLRPRAVSAAVDEVCSDLRSHQQIGGKQFDRLRAVLAVLRGPELEQFYARLGELQVPRVCAHAQAAVIRRAAEEHAADFFADQRPLHDDWPGDLDRAGLMDLIAASACWIYRNGESEAVNEVVEAIFDVIRWWPRS